MQITNSSRHEIFVILTPTYDKRIPKSPTQGIPSSSTKSYHINTGTMNLFIWDTRGNLVWRGIVPTLIKRPLIFSESGVMYGGNLLPQEIPGGTVMPAKQNWIIWILILLVIIGIIYGIVRFRT